MSLSEKTKEAFAEMNGVTFEEIRADQSLLVKCFSGKERNHFDPSKVVAVRGNPLPGETINVQEVENECLESMRKWQ